MTKEGWTCAHCWDKIPGKKSRSKYCPKCRKLSLPDFAKELRNMVKKPEDWSRCSYCGKKTTNQRAIVDGKPFHIIPCLKWYRREKERRGLA